MPEDPTPEDSTGRERSGPIIRLLVLLVMAVLIPARWLYPRETSLRGYRFAVITVANVYLLAAVTLGVAIHRWSSAGGALSWADCLAYALARAAPRIGLFWLICLFVVRRPLIREDEAAGN